MQNKEAYYKSILFDHGRFTLNHLQCSPREKRAVAAMIKAGSITCRSFDKITHVAEYVPAQKQEGHSPTLICSECGTVGTSEDLAFLDEPCPNSWDEDSPCSGTMEIYKGGK